MLAPSIPEREAERLAELLACGLLDTEPDPELERITRLAKTLFNVPYARLTLVDRHRVWFKCSLGLGGSEAPREISFCSHTILGPDVLLVEDATLDARFADNPAVAGAPNVRFYAGAPLELTPGIRIGSLCVIDDKPHTPTPEQLACLRDLARYARDEILRVRAGRAKSELSRFKDSLEKNQRLLQTIAESQLGAASSDSHENSLANLLGNLLSLTDCTAALLYEVKEGETGPGALQPLANASLQTKPMDRAVMRGIASRALSERQPQTLVSENAIALPIFDGSRVVAVLSFAGQSHPELVEFLAPAAAAIGPMLAQAKARRALMATEQKFQRLMTAAPVGITEISPDGEVVFANEFMQKLAGTSKLRHRNELAALIHPDDHDEVVRRWEQAARLGEELVSTHRLQRADGSVRWVQANVVEIETAERTRAVFGISTDISAQKELEQRLLEAKSAAESASRAKTDFLANVSHELRTPLNGVIGVTNLLSATELAPRQRALVGTIQKCSEALLTLISDILDLSKIEAGRLRLEETSFDVLRVLEDCIASELATAEAKGLTLETQFETLRDLWAFGDPSRLRQIVANLLNNAVKFTQKGTVLLAARRLSEGPEHVALELRVRDTGDGIAPEKLGELFERFTQADASTTRKFGGTGLGLAISKQLTNLMGGELEVSSRVGSGTTFTLQLSLRKAPAAPAVSTEEPCFFQARVLLVEDNDINQFVARGLLGQLGIAPETAKNGKDALALLDSRDFDLVLMDCQMPEMDGFEATRRIRAPNAPDRYRNVPVVALTASALEDDVDRCLAVGMNGHIAKPFTPAKLQQALLKHLPARCVQRRVS